MSENIVYYKVVLIFGVTGACRGGEFGNIKLKHIEEYGRIFLVKIPVTEAKLTRSYTISPDFYAIVKNMEICDHKRQHQNIFVSTTKMESAILKTSGSTNFSK